MALEKHPNEFNPYISDKRIRDNWYSVKNSFYQKNRSRDFDPEHLVGYYDKDHKIYLETKDIYDDMQKGWRPTKQFDDCVDDCRSYQIATKIPEWSTDIPRGHSMHNMFRPENLFCEATCKGVRPYVPNSTMMKKGDQWVMESKSAYDNMTLKDDTQYTKEEIRGFLSLFMPFPLASDLSTKISLDRALDILPFFLPITTGEQSFRSRINDVSANEILSYTAKDFLPEVYDNEDFPSEDLEKIANIIESKRSFLEDIYYGKKTSRPLSIYDPKITFVQNNIRYSFPKSLLMKTGRNPKTWLPLPIEVLTYLSLLKKPMADLEDLEDAFIQLSIKPQFTSDTPELSTLLEKKLFTICSKCQTSISKGTNWKTIFNGDIKEYCSKSCMV